jgi:hypothetical protein
MSMTIFGCLPLIIHIVVIHSCDVMWGNSISIGFSNDRVSIVVYWVIGIVNVFIRIRVPRVIIMLVPRFIIAIMKCQRLAGYAFACMVLAKRARS